MKQATLFGALFLGGIAIGAAATELVHAQKPQYETRQVLQADLSNLSGQELLIFASTWQPGFRLPLHMHPNGHEVTFVVEGEQTFEIEGVGTKIVRAGEAIYTPPNTPHFGRNASDKPSRTVVVRVKDKDKPVSVEVGAAR